MRIKQLLLIAFLTGLNGYADTVFIERTTGTGVEDDDISAVTEVVRSAVSQQGHTITSNKDKADFTLKPKLMRLGSAYLMTLDKVKSGRVAYSNQMKAKELEEMDRVATRLVRSTIDEKSVGHDVRVGETVHEESKQSMNRRSARNGTFVGVGPAWMRNVVSSSVGLWVSGGYAFDVNPVMVRLGAEFVNQGGAFFVDGGIGASYFFSDRDTTPFISADLGYGLETVTPIGGFTGGLGAGVQFLRTSTLNIEIAIRYAVMFQSTFPGFFGVRVALYF